MDSRYKIAVLGSNGFLGQYLTNRLVEDDYDVLPVNRQMLDLLNYNEVKNWLETNRPNIVINCAVAVNKSNYSEMDSQHFQNNIGIFMNFYNNSNLFDKFINIGTGAEFDLSRNIYNVKEIEIFNSYPTDSYGYSKNLMARLVLEKDNFYTLRLFGCFDSSEESFRLLKRFVNKQVSILDNKLFDYISASDFYKIVKFYIETRSLERDINCVYHEKTDLYSLLFHFSEIHNIVYNKKMMITYGNNNYCGNGEELKKLKLPLDGLIKGLKEYKI